MKKTFQQLIKEKIVILDGATGTNLQMRGMPQGVCPEQWILENKEILVGLQKEYVEAGSDIIYAPTFSANRIKLKEYGLQDKVEEMNAALVAISKEAAGEDVLVAGDMTMTGQQLEPLGSLSFDELLMCYKEQAKAIAGAGVDVFIVETMMSLQETRAAVLAIKEVCDIPVMVTMTFETSGRTLYGTDGVTALITLQNLGIAAFGINCSSGPENMIPMIETMMSYAKIPVIVKANAGLPQWVDGKTVFSMNAEDFARENIKLLEKGASIVGGCCGTTPGHIKALASTVAGFKPSDVATTYNTTEATAVTSERKTWFFQHGLENLEVNTLISAADNSDFCQELIDGEWDSLYDLAMEAEDEEPDVININVDADGVDGVKVMAEIFNELTVSICPVSVSSKDLKTLESALIHYPGRALIYDVSQTEEEHHAVEELAKRYGAVILSA